MTWGLILVLFVSLNGYASGASLCTNLFDVGKHHQEKIFITQQKSNVYYDEYNPTGSQTIVLFHGMGESSSSMDALASKLAQKYRVISLDMIGHGRDIKNVSDDVKLIDYKDNVRNAKELIESMGLKDFILVGHSYGGGIEIALARELTTKPKKLILLAPYTRRLDKLNYEQLKLSFGVFPIRLVDSISDGMMKRYLQNHYQTRFLNQWHKNYFELNEQEKELLKKKIQVAIATVRGVISLDIITYAFDISWSKDLPVVIIGAKNDTLVPHEQFKMLNDRFIEAGAKSQLEMIDGFDHDFPLNNANEAAKIILSHLSE